MKTKETSLLYGEEQAAIAVPVDADILESADSPQLPDVDDAIARALERPIGTPPLHTLLDRKKPRTVAVTISDITRAVPNRVFLPHLLRTVEAAGVERRNVSIIVGTGMHRPSTREEHIRLVGEEIHARYRVVDHDAKSAAGLVSVSGNPPVSVNALFMAADFKIVTGFIEPHFMAGFSGGRKGVCPALVDLDTVQKFHGYDTLSSPKAEAGILRGNPCHEIALAVANTAGVDFLFNVTLNRAFRMSGIFCGDLEEAHRAGCSFASRHATCCISAPYDLVVTCGGGYPLDCNYYQTVKGMCMALPAAKNEGFILIASECREGVGSGAYTDLLFSYDGDWRRFLSDIAANRETTKLDQWEFQMHCRVLEKTGASGLHFLSRGIPFETQARLYCTPVRAFNTIAGAVESFVRRFAEERPRARIAVVPSGPYTIIRRAGTLDNL